MREALVALNELVEDEVIPTYAIGGAVGAAFYMEAQNTEDVDVFVLLPEAPNSLLVTLSPLYEACKRKGGVPEGVHIRFGAWLVQFLPASTQLEVDALREAIRIDYEGTSTRVLTAEHLCAICLQTRRLKDYSRVEAFIGQGTVDVQLLKDLLERYNLSVGRDQVPNWPPG